MRCGTSQRVLLCGGKAQCKRENEGDWGEQRDGGEGPTAAFWCLGAVALEAQCSPCPPSGLLLNP